MNLQEDYVSFELAKLLKEKGFNAMCEHYFSEGLDGSISCRTATGHWNAVMNFIARPSLSLAMKWLREKGIYLNIRIALSRMEDDVINNIHWVVDILDFSSGEWKDNDIWADTYKEAVEAALKYSLKNLI